MPETMLLEVDIDNEEFHLILMDGCKWFVNPAFGEVFKLRPLEREFEFEPLTLAGQRSQVRFPSSRRGAH